MQDLRVALRSLARRPAFLVIAVLTLALGIGANTAVFTVSSAVLLAPLPYHEPDRVVVLYESTPQFPLLSVTRYNYEDWRDKSRSFAGVGAFRPLSMTLTGRGDPERVPVKMITSTLLPVLGVTIEQGRNFLPDEDQPGAEDVAIVASPFAARAFHGENPVGRVIQLDARTYTIVGVMPPAFELFVPADVYVPFGPWAATLPEDRGWHPGIVPIARLRDGVTLDDARRELEAISRQLEAEYPESNRNVRGVANLIQDQHVQNVRPALVMLTGAVMLVLLIACANVANLLLARAVERQKEIAVRIALGAGRIRIIRQLVVESLVLALIGGSAGLLFASWAAAFLGGAATSSLPRAQNIAMDWPVVMFALGISVVTGFVFGLVPALHATHVPVQQSLNEESRGGSGGIRQQKLRSALVVAEIALALVLLVGAGLMLRSFSTLVRVHPGFDFDNLLLVNLPLSPRKYGDEFKRAGAVREIVTGVKALPGVRSAAITTTVPMAGPGPSIHFNRMAYPPKGPDDYVMAGYRAVTPEYLTTVGVPLLKGRLLNGNDRRGMPPVVVVNESFARLFFPDRGALGERIQLGTIPDPGSPAMEIVGIVGDVKQSFFDPGSKAEMFVPYEQFPGSLFAGMYLNTVLVVRTSVEPAEVTSSVRSVLRHIDPSQPLVNIRTMTDSMGATVAQPRLQMTLVTVFAVVALVLAGVGVYGVMGYIVSLRVAEIGIRIAVGAAPDQVVRLIVTQAAWLTAKGIAVGLVAAFIAAGAMRGLLFRIAWLDPFAFVLAPLVLAAIAVFASYIPARRAAGISPVLALQR